MLHVAGLILAQEKPIGFCYWGNCGSASFLLTQPRQTTSLPACGMAVAGGNPVATLVGCVCNTMVRVQRGVKLAFPKSSAVSVISYSSLLWLLAKALFYHVMS